MRNFLPLVLGLAVASRVEAQATPAIIYACYVPLTGTVYRIKEADLKPACTSAAHVGFSWTSGSGTSSHGALSGLANDDHPQYLLTDGTRSTTNGFVVNGTFGSGGIPATGPGTRMMWYPAKAAFRAGDATGVEWDDAAIGQYSVAMGQNARASGFAATAFGYNVTASGGTSVALGQAATASNSGSTAIGISANASGFAAVAIGGSVQATGSNSVALGASSTASGSTSMALGYRASTNGFDGAFVYGDHNLLGGTVEATAAHQFTVRASGGFRLRTSPTLTTGCDLPAGSGTWACTSSRLAKERFENLNGDDVLQKIDGMAIQAWSYRTEPGNIRHVGPTAQDFRAAFGLGTSDEAISLVDIDGVNLLGVQALTRRANDQARQIETLRAENARQAERLAVLEKAIARLTAGETRP